MLKGKIVDIMVGWHVGIDVNLVLDHGLEELLIARGQNDVFRCYCRCLTVVGGSGVDL